MTDQTPYRHETSGEAINRSSSAPNTWKYVLTALISAMFTFVVTAAILIAVFFSFGPQTSTPGSFSIDLKNNDEETRRAADKLKTIYHYINNEYYRELSEAEMLEAMSAGLAFSMESPYTMYLTAEQNALIEESMSGEYSGIGAIVAMGNDGLIEITELVENGPAIEAGLQIGDVFVSVNGEDVTSLPDVSTLAAMVRGPADSKVEIEIYRPSERSNLKFSPVRRKIENASVRYKMLDEKIGYISISEFSHGVAQNFIAAVDKLQQEGAESIVFDLRNNGGGLADEVVDMLDYLLPELTLATLEGRSSGQVFERSWESDAKMGVPENMRFAVIINQFSASASELFSGCLQDYDKAVLVGKQSFGKGSGTITFPLSDGSALTVTNFLYYLPDGESIEGKGLTPDIDIELPDEARVKSVAQLTIEEDTQLSAAIEQLQLD